MTGATGKKAVVPCFRQGLTYDAELGAQSLEPYSAPPELDETKRTRLQNALVTGSLMLSLFLSALDVTIVATAVPTIAEDLESTTGYVWIGAAYVLANAAFSPLWGRLSDIWGRKVIILTTIGVFWVGSLLCGAAVNMQMLLAARGMQGIGGGGVGTLVNICIGDLFPVHERGFYYGLVGAVWGVSSAIGPLVGGVLSSQVSWRWCFYINLPISGVGIVALYFTLELYNPRTALRDGLKTIDWLGSFTILSGTFLLLLGLEFGGVSYPWISAAVVCLVVIGLAMIVVFIVVEWRFAQYPIVPLGLFSNRSNVAAFITTFCHTMVSNSGSYWLPLYFQGVLARSALLSGVYILPFLMAMCIVSAASGFIIRSTGNYVYIIGGGMAVTTLGFGLFINLPADIGLVKIISYQIIAGVGLGPNYQSPLIALQNNVEPHNVGSTTSTFGFIRQLATAISIVIGGVVFNSTMDRQQTRLIVALGPELAKKFAGDSAPTNVLFIDTLDARESSIVRRAYLAAVRTMYILFVVVSSVGLLASIWIKQRKMSRDHSEHQTGLQSLKRRVGRDEKW